MARNSANTNAEQPTPTAKRFKLPKLAEACRTLFGVSSSTFAGATADLKADGEYTVDELRSHIEGWKKKTITKEGKK